MSSAREAAEKQLDERAEQSIVRQTTLTLRSLLPVSPCISHVPLMPMRVEELRSIQNDAASRPSRVPAGRERARSSNLPIL